MRRFLQDNFIHILFSSTVMGAWATFANWAHPRPQPLISGLVQGASAACITYFLKRLIEWLATKFTDSTALWAPPLIACSATLCVLIAAHSVVGTPELVRTIALPFSIGSIYAAIFNYSLWIHRDPKMVDEDDRRPLASRESICRMTNVQQIECGPHRLKGKVLKVKRVDDAKCFRRGTSVERAATLVVLSDQSANIETTPSGSGRGI
jgi:hypothetical protein